MANMNGPFGFAVTSANGADYAGRVGTYYIPSTDTNQYNIGDAVKVAGGSDANGVVAITKSAGTDGEYQRGVIVGVLPVDSVGTPTMVGNTLALEQIGVPASKTRAYYVQVNDNPDAVYEIQADGTAAITAAMSSKNATFTPASPTFPQQISLTTLDSGTVATTATFPLRIMGLARTRAPGGGNSLGKYAVLLVKFNLHDLNSAGATGV